MILDFLVLSASIYVSNHSSASFSPKIALYTLSPSALITSSVCMLWSLCSRSSMLEPSVPSLADPNTRMWMYAPSAAGKRTLPNRCRPYAEAATLTKTRSDSENWANWSSEREETARKYSGSCSAWVRRLTHFEGKGWIYYHGPDAA